jgi:probable rRNA maturation factor
MLSNQEKNNRKIKFRFQKKINLSNRIIVKQTLLKLFKKQKKALCYLDIIFCSDEYLLDINKANLDHDYFTDTITFDFTPKGQKETIGEIYISADRVKENATTYKISFQNELLRVMIHSTLHLCGYKDKSPSQKKEMTRLEDQFIKTHQRLCSTWNKR